MRMSTHNEAPLFTMRALAWDATLAVLTGTALVIAALSWDGIAHGGVDDPTALIPPVLMSGLAALLAWNTLFSVLAYLSAVSFIPVAIQRLLMRCVARCGSARARTILRRRMIHVSATATLISALASPTALASPYVATESGEELASPSLHPYTLVQGSASSTSALLPTPHSPTSPPSSPAPLSPAPLSPAPLSPAPLSPTLPSPALPSPALSAEALSTPLLPTPALSPPSRGGSPESSAADASSLDDDTYTVAPGDSLWTISANLLATDDPSVIARVTAELYAANAQIIGQNPDIIHPGMVLNLPEIMKVRS